MYHLAASGSQPDHLDILKYLAKTATLASVALNRIDGSGNTPLDDANTSHCPHCHKHKDVVEFLGKNGALPARDVGNHQNKLSLTSKFMEAAKGGDIDEMKRLISAGVGISEGSLDGGYGETALHVAASEGLFNVVEFLVKQGANTTIIDRRGKYPHENAEHKGYTDIEEFLIEATSHTVKACHQAASEDDVETLKRIAEGGANINIGDPDERTALHVAAKSGKTKAVVFLLSKGANPCVKDRYGKSPMDDGKDFPEVAARLNEALDELQEDNVIKQPLRLPKKEVQGGRKNFLSRWQNWFTALMSLTFFVFGIFLMLLPSKEAEENQEEAEENQDDQEVPAAEP